MSRNTAVALVSQFLGRQNTIPVPVPFVRLTGDYASAAFLAQCLYWGDRTTDPEGWFHKTHDQWFDELMLSPDQVRRCVKTCGDMIEVKRKGVPAQNYYRANKEAVAEALERLALESQDSTSRCGETQHLDADKPHDKTPGNPTASRTAEPTSITKPTSEPTQSPQQRERAGEPDKTEDRTRSPGEGEQQTRREEGGAVRAEAPDGARAGPAVTVTGSGSFPANPGKASATSTEKVPGAAPPGGAAGADAARPDPGRAALLELFGEGFLNKLLGEAPVRAGWVKLSPARIDELHQEALREARAAGEHKPWRTPLINKLDIEAAKLRQAARSPTRTSGPVDMDALIRNAPLNGRRSP